MALVSARQSHEQISPYDVISLIRKWLVSRTTGSFVFLNLYYLFECIKIGDIVIETKQPFECTALGCCVQPNRSVLLIASSKTMRCSNR